MKKFLLIGLLSLGLIGCSSLELGDALSSDQYTQNILALGLTHEENLIEASKLKTPHLVSVVTLQLTNARDAEIQNKIDLIASDEFASMVIISSDGLKFIGSNVSESKKTGILETDIDIQNFHLEGIKNPNNGLIDHKLVLSVAHNSRNERQYSSANLCYEWNRCDSNKQEINFVSSSAANCSSSSCDYKELMELSLSDNFLRKTSNTGFKMQFNAKRKSNKINVSKSYLMWYLKVAQ